MGSRLKLQPDEIYQFCAEIRWIPHKTTTTTTTNDNNISINVVYPTGYSVDEETTKQLNKFCFPTGQPTFSSPERFCFVLTDQDGLFRFGFCRYDTIRKCCMFLLSYLPWFDCFYSFLLMLQGYTSTSEKDETKKFMPSLMLERLHKLSLPPPEALSISLCNSDVNITLQQALTNPQDPLSMLPSLPIPSGYTLPKLSECQNLQMLFSHLDTPTILSVFSSLLQERRIIVSSRNLTDLTAVVHGFNQLLYPLFWQHIFIPVLPQGLTDYCCAPMPFLCGIPEQLMPRVKSLPLEDVVILDIDTSTLETPFEDHLCIPKELLQNISIVLKKPTSRQDSTIPEAFLYLFVVLLGGYRCGMKQYEEKIVFDQDLFKESQPVHIHGMLDKLFQLQMFDQFIASRTLYLKSYTDDPFGQEVRKYKGPTHKTAQQKFSDFGDKIVDAKSVFVTKMKDLEIVRSHEDLKTQTNEMFKQANSGMKNLRTFLNKQIAKSSVITSLKTKPQNETFTHSTSSVDFNEIERQFHTIGKRQSTVAIVQRTLPPVTMADVKRPDRPPPPIPPPYSKHKENKTNQFLTESEPRRHPLTPPLPQRKLATKAESVNLISFDGQNDTGFLSSSIQQPQRPPPLSIPPRRQTIPHPTQLNYGTTTTTTTNLLLITPTTDTTLDELLSYSNNSKSELN